ncbi:MAG: hypothetical protein RKP46_03470 [Candidatus Accumulibacter sp.]|uniref:hypothetical protein n=1 Tax=Accumulibacter sp. TaxID=2053492 RepID=UPI00287A89FF|nr:hypothetical protein [Accumulibacter sp.]MDS4013399.1 hypothetical protein [Accumulibacter sp.]
MNGLRLVLLLALAFCAPLFSGCTQMPTEKQGVSDLRPQISFRVADENLRQARVIVDGLEVGAVEDYLEGAAALRVLSGNHVVHIEWRGQRVLEEKVYVGDGVHRTIVVR